ncbi:MAG: energy transducer TonB [Bacteroidetes bacterium]|nr:energy transducer TonB [Bacteroidota bacterium]
MELKKSKDASIENLRAPIVFIGFLFIGSLVLASFSYSSAIEEEDNGDGEKRSTAIKYSQEEKKEDTPPPPTPPQVDTPPPPQEEIVEKKNTEKEPEVVVVIAPPDLPKGPETKVEVKEEIIEFPDVEAQFPGGAAELQKWIAQNVQYPQTSIEMNEQGKVYLSFVVESNGDISNITVERGVSGDLDREAKRLVRSMPKWVPGEASGRKAKTRCRLPINFTLN